METVAQDFVTNVFKTGKEIVVGATKDVIQYGKDRTQDVAAFLQPEPQRIYSFPKKWNHSTHEELLTQVCMVLQYTRLAFAGRTQVEESELLRAIGQPMFYFDECVDTVVDKWRKGRRYTSWARDINSEGAFRRRRVIGDVNSKSGANLLLVEDLVWYGCDEAAPVDKKWIGGNTQPTAVLVIGSKGTDEFIDHLQDLQQQPHTPTLLRDAVQPGFPAFPPRAKVVKGFYLGYAGNWLRAGASERLSQMVFDWIADQEALGRRYRVFVGGHSFGAGVATAAFTHLMLQGLRDATLITFGSPRLCNEEYAKWQAQVLEHTGCVHLNVFVGGDLATYYPFRFPKLGAALSGWFLPQTGRPVQQGYPVEVDEWIGAIVRHGKRFNYEGDELCFEMLDETKAYAQGGGKHMFYMGLNLMNVRWTGLFLQLRPANNWFFENKKRRERARARHTSDVLWWPGTASVPEVVRRSSVFVNQGDYKQPDKTTQPQPAAGRRSGPSRMASGALTARPSASPQVSASPGSITARAVPSSPVKAAGALNTPRNVNGSRGIKQASAPVTAASPRRTNLVQRRSDLPAPVPRETKNTIPSDIDIGFGIVPSRQA